MVVTLARPLRTVVVVTTVAAPPPGAVALAAARAYASPRPPPPVLPAHAVCHTDMHVVCNSHLLAAGNPLLCILGRPCAHTWRNKRGCGEGMQAKSARHLPLPAALCLLEP